MNIELALDAQFDARLERGDVFADTGIRYVVGDTYLDGSPSEYYVSEFVVPHLRRLCDAVASVMAGEEIDLHYLDTSHHLFVEPVDEETVAIWTSDSESVQIALQELVRGVVVAAEELESYVVDVNPALSNTAEVRKLRTAIENLHALYEAEFGDE